ncbi:glycosyl hydrolase [Paenibacillus nanensis]|uniref:Glycosyl hydrolase n=1 Tax=Paenibacillus nanensis TaxID=393251 RepID=A0A3A1UPG9_9BACL|nr:glycosyl hydrolase family 18 protein [Paenibacillus nanensis]RIX49237.1 glycosyl hydrolase [Paenibacillus nanensis]
MKRRKWRNRMLLALAAVAVLGAAVWRYGDELRGMAGGAEQESAASAETALSAWIVDWDAEAGAADLAAVAASLESLQLFGAYYDEQRQITLREGFNRLIDAADEAALEENGGERYLTVVNDILLGNGNSLQKDTGLVSNLAATVESRRDHAEEVVALAKEYGFDGVELDYERIADADWPHVIALYNEMHQSLSAEGLKLRVLVEPGAPVTQHLLPEGPQYVIMAYNLYGTHSGPGPKADLAMIGKLAAKMDHIPGDPVMAFAAGGFDWNAEGAASAVTEIAAAKLAESAGVQPERDRKSGALYFAYTDEQGDKHTVWYADQETLRLWIEGAKQRGVHRVAIWRLGGISESSLDYLSRQF